MNRTAGIRIGNQSAFSASTVTQPFEYAVANGFDAFEWFPDKKESGEGWEESDLDAETRHYVKDTALKHDIRLSVHAPWQANPLRQEDRQALLKSIEFANDISASLLNIHLYTDEGIASYVQAITPLIEDLAKLGIELSIENMPVTGPEDFNELFAQLAKLVLTDAARVGMCLDIGHANLCEATRNDYIRFIDLLDPRIPIIHIHMHENYGDYDSHLPLFAGPAGKDASGIMAVIGRMRKRRFSGSIILEQWPQPPSLLIEARDRLREIIGDGGRKVIGRDHFADRIAEANQRCRSWRDRLAWIGDCLADSKSDLRTEQLVYLATYLRFIGTGQIPSGEDGKHYRPSHHAKTARRIHDRLAQITTAENVFIIRKIYPWLPSYDNAFTGSEPLTRIRDIAHRNDIPKELKQEIKHTLQNKLHRCAGPEDLATSEGLLLRITAAGADYSPSFVEAFMRFHEDLKEFFNARSLDEQLVALSQKSRAWQADLIREFLDAKEKAVSPEELEAAFELMTRLRSQLKDRLKGNTSAEAQDLQLADIRLEDFSFVLLSRVINHLDGLKDKLPWLPALHLLALTIENLRLSGFDANECQAIEAELAAWSQGFDPRDRIHLIRLKATIDRCRRLAEVYCKKILSMFSDKVERLGRALGVAEEAIKAFCEADIRNHLVFQLSKLVGPLLGSIRTIAALPLWDPIVPGRVSGRVAEALCLDDLIDPFDESIVALLDEVKGDEEIPTAVVGMIVARETPYLSHLAVRARQAKVVFVASEDKERFVELRHFVGKRVILDVSAAGINLEILSDLEDGGASDRKGETGQEPLEIPDVSLSSPLTLLPLDQVALQTGGSKADGVRRLKEMSQMEQAGFTTPPGLVIPFGVMEASLAARPALRQAYRALIDQLNELKKSDFLEALEKLRGIIRQLEVPREIVSGVMERFSKNERLMVRSSANCEDLEGFSGAGLYESVGNVSPSDVAQGVGKVWSSLWSERAAMNRRRLRIPHDRAHVAVLIQQMLIPDLSFIMHTVNPVDHQRDEACVELTVGLGETLAGGKIPGAAYRMGCNKQTGAVRMLAFASFSQALWPDVSGSLVHKTIDYSRVELSKNEIFGRRLGSRLGKIGRFVEDALGGPQDIEGLVLADEIYLVQARPQQGEMRDVEQKE
ncbi:MAG: TIM barrel protein [Deltaproteobacteria bacterium]|nr:TIM barrel protein [Deltaproteobacteria bacterium]